MAPDSGCGPSVRALILRPPSTSNLVTSAGSSLTTQRRSCTRACTSTPPEFDVLATLPGRRLVKTRWSVPVGPDADPSSLSGSVNVFEEDLAGLILLEIDLGSQALLDAFTPPVWVGPEVTADEAFTGGSLAGTSFADIAPAIAAAVATKGACRSA